MRFFINGTEYEPANRNQFEVSFANSEITDGREGQLTNDVLQFFAPSEGFDVLENLFQTNATEAVSIRVEDIGLTLFDGYGSFLHPDTLISPDEIQLKMLDQYQSIKERIDVLTFDLLHEKGFITSTRLHSYFMCTRFRGFSRGCNRKSVSGYCLVHDYKGSHRNG